MKTYNINTCDDPELVAAHRALNKVTTQWNTLQNHQERARDLLNELQSHLPEAADPFDDMPRLIEMIDVRLNEALRLIADDHDKAEAHFDALHAAWAAGLPADEVRARVLGECV